MWNRYVFYKLLFFEPTRGLILGQAKAVTYLLDLMHDTNLEIQRICENALDIVMEHDEGILPSSHRVIFSYLYLKSYF